MDCPACSRGLVTVLIGGVSLDICQGGCGGIWFDNFELHKFDEPKESAGEELLAFERSASLKVDTTHRRKCPKCTALIMMRHLFSPNDDVTIDECPGCAGIWLDPGELAAIRSRFETEAERKAATEKFIDEKIAPKISQLRKEGEQDRQKVDRFVNMLRFICPSTYVPGKQGSRSV